MEAGYNARIASDLGHGRAGTEFPMICFTDRARRIARSLRALVRMLPAAPRMMMFALVAGVPVALSASLAVASYASAQSAVERVIALPAVHTQPTWDAEIAGFSTRLQDSFGVDASRADDFARWILEASERQALPPDLIASLIYTESTFRTRVRSFSGAIGPAQVKPRFWSRFCGGVDLTDPEQNVYCGAQVVAHYMEQCGDFECALRLYNVGPSNYRDPYYRSRSHAYLAKIENGRERFARSEVLDEPVPPAVAAF